MVVKAKKKKDGELDMDIEQSPADIMSEKIGKIQEKIDKLEDKLDALSPDWIAAMKKEGRNSVTVGKVILTVKRTMAKIQLRTSRVKAA